MKTIYHFPLPSPDAAAQVFLPGGVRAKILHVGLRNGAPTMWAEVKTALPVLPVRVQVVGTGFDLSDLDSHCEMSYVGTIHQDWLLWHVYAEKEKTP